MRKVVAASLCALLLATTSAMAVQVFNQPADLNTAWASQNDPTSTSLGNFATAYDNFTLASGASVTGATWVGGYFNPSVQGSITQFTIAFWSDSAGHPGSVLSTQGISGNASETFLGTDNASDAVFSYSATLATPFVAAAGTQYWLSIVPDMAFPPQWGWETSAAGDGNSYQDFLGTRYQHPTDLAFSLDSAAVPLPSAAFGAIPLALMALAFRRRALR